VQVAFLKQYLGQMTEPLNGQNDDFSRISLTGDRFDGGFLPVSALVEIQRYAELLGLSAENAWHLEHGSEDLPEDFHSEFDPIISRIDPGSAMPVFELPSDSPHAHYFDVGRDDLVRVLGSILDETADEIEPGVDLLSASLVPAFETRAEYPGYVFSSAFVDFGSSLGESESLILNPIHADGDNVVELTPKKRRERILPLYEAIDIEPGMMVDDAKLRRRDINTVAMGQVTALDAENRTLKFKLLNGETISGRYKDSALTSSLKELVNSSSSASVIRVEGRFRGDDDGLKLLAEAREVEKFEIDGESWSHRLLELAGLDEGWDGGQAPRIGFAALDAVRSILKAEALTNVARPSIFPEEGGGVRAEWLLDGKIVYTEISEDLDFVVEVFAGGELMTWNERTILGVADRIKGQLND